MADGYRLPATLLWRDLLTEPTAQRRIRVSGWCSRACVQDVFRQLRTRKRSHACMSCLVVSCYACVRACAFTWLGECAALVVVVVASIAQWTFVCWLGARLCGSTHLLMAVDGRNCLRC